MGASVDPGMSADALMRQAVMTAEHYLDSAVDGVARQLGAGDYPELVAAFMQAAAIDFATAMLTVKAQELIAAVDTVAAAIDAATAAIECLET